MTIDIAENVPRISYSVAQGVTQTSFAVPFEFFDNSDLNVYVDGTLKTITTNYTVSGGSGTTGTVTMSVTGGTGGSTVILTREIPLDRTTDFPTSGAFQVAALNTELDRLVAIQADLQDDVNRSLRLTDYDVSVSLVLPDVTTRKGKTLAFNESTGAVESGPSISDTQSVADASADIELLADIQDGTVATDAITNVNTIRTDVTTVSGISADVTINATNIVAIQGAATNADNAATSASNASTSASNASTSASNAATSASNAATSASASEAAKDAALSALDSFDDRYLGAKATDPTLDNDGNALVSGALYYNTTDNIMKVYTGSAWVAAYASLEGAVLKVGDTMTGNLTLSNAAELIFNDSADDYNLKFNGGTVFSILSNNEDSFQWLFNDNAKMILDFETLDINTDVTINPNKKITFGVSNELEIYYNSATNEAIIAQVDDGDLVLSSNAEISLTTDVLVDGSVSITDAVDAKLSLSGPLSSIDMYDTDSVNSGTRFESYSSGLLIKSLNDDGTATQHIIELNCSNGNIIFFDDTSTEGVHWNAATKRLGIGNVSAATALDVTGTITADGLTVNGNVGIGGVAYREFQIQDGNTFSGGSRIVAAFTPSILAAETAGIALGVFSDDEYWKQGIFWTRTDSYGVGDLHFANRGTVDTTTVSVADAKMTIDSSGNVGIGETSPLGKLHVKTADSGATVDASADDLVIEGSGNTGMTILSGASNTGSIYFGDSGTNWDGYIAYSQSTRSMTLGVAAGGGTLKIDSSGNVGIGTSSPATSYKNALQVHGADGGGNIRITNDTTGTGTGNGFEVIVSGIDAYLIQRETAPIIFYTSGAEALRIDASGNLAFPTGQGIDFSAVTGGTGTATSNVLDDYEEGTWTPTLIPDAGTPPTLSTSNAGSYTKVGRFVTLIGYIQVNSISGNVANFALISGIPFTPLSGAGYEPVGVIMLNGLNLARPDNAGISAYGSSSLGLLTANNNGGWGWESFSIFTGGDAFRFSISYYTT